MTAARSEELEAALGHHFSRPDLLEDALTHRSRRQEKGIRGSASDNERLEFLGDAVLSLAVSEYLCHAFPDWREGRLSKSRARLVNAASLRLAAARLHLGRHLRLGRGEEKTGGREKLALLAGAYEAVVAAIYLDAGLEAARAFIRRSLLDPALPELAERLGESDYKSALQEWLQGRGLPAAEYRVTGERGPDHRKTFSVEVRVRGRTMACSEGSSKKEAEQCAARLALERLRAEAAAKESA